VGFRKKGGGRGKQRGKRKRRGRKEKGREGGYVEN